MGQIIVLSSINSGSGKTLLVSHLAVMLAKDYKVAVVDNRGENASLANFVAQRHALNISKNFSLPTPFFHSLHTSNIAQLEQDFDVIIIDSPEEKYFKRADIFLTPLWREEGIASVNSKDSLYATLLWEARKRRAAEGKSSFRWIVVPNDIYQPEQYNQLKATSKLLGYTIAPNLNRRTKYAEGMATGITSLDKDLPKLKTLFDLPDLYARRELKKLAAFIWQNK